MIITLLKQLLQQKKKKKSKRMSLHTRNRVKERLRFSCALTQTDNPP